MDVYLSQGPRSPLSGGLNIIGSVGEERDLSFAYRLSPPSPRLSTPAPRLPSADRRELLLPPTEAGDVLDFQLFEENSLGQLYSGYEYGTRSPRDVPGRSPQRNEPPPERDDAE